MVSDNAQPEHGVVDCGERCVSLETRLSDLESRLAAAEDHLAIINLLNVYGPLVDGGGPELAPELWAEGGGYVFSGSDGESMRVEAPDGLAGLFKSRWHEELIRNGSAHLTATPRVVVRGDEAEAVGYSFVVSRDGERWSLLRAAINRWTLRRTPSGWRIMDRVNRLLNGSPDSRTLMRAIIRDDTGTTRAGAVKSEQAPNPCDGDSRHL